MLTYAQVSVTVTGTNVSCYNGYNGTATAIGSGGWAPYTYHWSNGQTTATITGLAIGTYSVTVTDIDMGLAVGSITITQPTQLGVQAYGESQICGLVPDGKATAVPFGGTLPYTYLWSNGGTTPQITGLAAGTYTVTVTDAKGCVAVASADVYFWNEGVWIMDTSFNVTCYGLNNGSASAMGMSGTPPYTYHWSNGQNTSVITGLAPGNYTVTVADANGCSNFTTVSVSQPTQVTATTTSTNAFCGIAGTATVTGGGGIAPYSIHWFNNATTPTISVMAGTYSVTVTDANGCTAVAAVTVSGTNTGLILSANVTGNAGCNIGGTASVNVTGGGSGTYGYTWDNGQTTQSATNLTAGVHNVTVTDLTSGCVGVGQVNIPSAPVLSGSAQLVSNATCLVGGSATANGSGGTPPYTYHWDNGQNTATATNLGAGPHNVTITDATGCVVVKTVTIGQSQGPTVTAQPLTAATCTVGGSASATATGGSGTYTYLWDNNQTTQTATNLTPGVHKVTATDSNGCSAMATVTITQTNTPTLVVAGSSPAGCTTGGSATVAASGGTTPYASYKWSNGAMGATVNNLPAGTYVITVTDAAGCTATATLSIAAPIPPNVVITASSNANCSQPGSATASAAGGVPPFTYHWDNGETTATAINLTAGAHSVTVTGADGCTGTANVNIGSTNNGIKIGDYVWYDTNQNGFQDAGIESGVPNFTVKLMKAGPDGIFGTNDDITVGTTTTNANGLYYFDCVPPGTYVLMFSGLPSGFEYTDKDKVNNDCLDSDVKANGKTDPFTIVAGQSDNLCFDAGIHQFCDNVLNAGVICCDQTICEGETPTILTAVQAPSGGTGPLEYVWMQLVQMGPAPPQWVGIPGANSASYQPGALYQTSYFMRCAKRQGCLNFLESNFVTITVVPAGTGSCPSFMMQMTVQQMGPTAVSVKWTTFPEGEQYMYTLQRSSDQANWRNIASTMGINNHVDPNHYELMDQTPQNGANYYRIKRASASGTVIYSDVLSIDLRIGSLQTVSVYPNPVTSTLTISNSQLFDGDVIVQISTTKGEVLNTITIPKNTIQNIDLPVEELPQGLYLARIKFSNGDVKTLKISKF